MFPPALLKCTRGPLEMCAQAWKNSRYCIIKFYKILEAALTLSFLINGSQLPLVVYTADKFSPSLLKQKRGAFLDANDAHWLPATATWYGSSDGDGSDGGACGYGSLVDVRPLRARVGAVSPILFKDGEGCGACYKVRCADHSICSRRAVTVIVTDECPGGYCAFGRTHFDLSGAAFSRMAIAGHDFQLRNRGEISVLYRRTPCKYHGKKLAFHVNEGSTEYWLSLLVEFEDGDGDIGSMHIKSSTSTEWQEMKHLWGANWCIIGGPLVGPFSVRVTTLSTQRSLSARDVIPRNWSPKATYTSRLNFF